MDVFNRYIELKRNRLAEIAEQMTRLRGELDLLGKESAKLRTMIDTAEDMRREVTESGGAEALAAEAPAVAEASATTGATGGDLPDTAPEPAQVVTADAEAAQQIDTGAAIRRRPRGGVSLIDGIRQIVRELPPPISTGAVRTEVQERYPELAAQSHYSSISGTMRRMERDNELVLVQKGGPGKEATYRLPEA